MKTNIRKRLLSWCPQPKTSETQYLIRLSNHQKRSRLIYAVPAVAVVIIAILLAFLYFTSTIGPGPVKIEVSTDKQSYSQGETVRFNVFVTNQNLWRVLLPTEINYKIADGGQVINSMNLPGASFPALSRTLLGTFVWDQKNFANRTQVQPGNYTLNVSFSGPTDYGASVDYTIQIR